MTMPTTESNARAIATRKGYEIRQERDSIVAVGPDGLRYAAEQSWPAMLRWAIGAPRLDDDGGAAA